jgi:hypothetical protein
LLDAQIEQRFPTGWAADAFRGSLFLDLFQF